jgi:hypothetical protein
MRHFGNGDKCNALVAQQRHHSDQTDDCDAQN